MAVAGLAPAGVVFGFGAALVASGLFYGLPMAVQPVKAVSAVLLAAQLSPGAVAAIGLMIGGVLLLLGLTGLIGRAARLIPQSITAGLQLGLGIMMGWLGLTMVAAPPDWCLALVLLLGMPRLLSRVPVAPLVLLAAIMAGVASGETAMPTGVGFDLRLPSVSSRNCAGATRPQTSTLPVIVDPRDFWGAAFFAPHRGRERRHVHQHQSLRGHGRKDQ